MSRIVVGVDGSANARAALEWAVDEAVLRDATVEVVLVWQEPYYGGSLATPVTLDLPDLEPSHRERLAKIVADTDSARLASPIVETLAHGSAADQLVTRSADADLLVVGSRGHGGFLGLLLGSVTTQVAAHATCPVVIVPEPSR